MISTAALRNTAREYLRAAKLLRTRRSYDASVYLCGYAVEIALKACICRTLNWTTGFPETNAEFRSKGNLKTQIWKFFWTTQVFRIKSGRLAHKGSSRIGQSLLNGIRRSGTIRAGQKLCRMPTA